MNLEISIIVYLKAFPEYQEAIESTTTLEEPAVGFARPSEYKAGKFSHTKVVREFQT